MPNPAFAYTQRPDTGVERELSALANVYRLILESAKQSGRLPDKSGPDDEKEGFRNDSLAANDFTT